jgi:hypothetical protein
MWACNYQYSQEGEWDSLELHVDCYQLTENMPHPFQRLKLKFASVKSFVFQEVIGLGGHGNLYGINYLYADDHFHFDFSNEFETSIVKMQEESTFYVMSESFSFEIVKTLE